jgi:hypothetical protein
VASIRQVAFVRDVVHVLLLNREVGMVKPQNRPAVLLIFERVRR